MTATKFLTALAATFITLLVLWCTAGTASAAVFEEGPCRAVPLIQSARPGETVRVCELHQVPSVVAPTSRGRSVARAATRRTGHTVVMARLGVRGALRVASR